MSEETKVEVEVVEAEELKDAVKIEEPKQSLIGKAWDLTKKNWKKVVVGGLLIGAGAAGYVAGKNSGNDDDYSSYSADDSDDDDYSNENSNNVNGETEY